MENSELLKEQKQTEQKLIKCANSSLFERRSTEEDVARVVSRWTEFPPPGLLEEAKKLENMEETLNKKVMDKKRRFRQFQGPYAGPRQHLEENKPLGSFCSWGQLAGQTETARALAEFLFNDERR
jgi:ATP-dependent Clp protease ATP-binding subunit ClpB